MSAVALLSVSKLCRIYLKLCIDQNSTTTTSVTFARLGNHLIEQLSLLKTFQIVKVVREEGLLLIRLPQRVRFF